uniref:Protein kinase domain-containing protein n=1 Tax=Macrostomum lignano TaxID=282301 RepID=A0A1I8IL94_9PLAT
REATHPGLQFGPALLEHQLQRGFVLFHSPTQLLQFELLGSDRHGQLNFRPSGRRPRLFGDVRGGGGIHHDDATGATQRSRRRRGGRRRCQPVDRIKLLKENFKLLKMESILSGSCRRQYSNFNVDDEFEFEAKLLSFRGMQIRHASAKRRGVMKVYPAVIDVDDRRRKRLGRDVADVRLLYGMTAVRCQITKAASDGALRSLGANKGRTAGRVRGAGVSQQTVDVAPSPRLSPPHLLHRLRTVGLGADDVACQLESPTAQQIARTGQAGAMIERRVGDSLVADLEGGAQQASVRRVDLSLERVSALYNRTVSITAWNSAALWRSGKSSATPQILADVGNQTAEVDELLTSWKLTRLSVSASAEDCSLGVHDGLLRVDHQADARRNGNQPIQLSLGALDGRGQQGEVIGVAKHAEPSLRLASTHASPQQEAVVVGRQSSPINRNGASVSPWSTPEDVSKKSDRPSGVETAAVVPWYSAMTAEISSSGTLYARSTSGSASLTTESKAFLKSTKIRIRVNWRMRASSMTRRRARICVTVPRWGRNPFCSGRRYGSSTGCNRDSSMRLNSFAAQDCRQMPRCSSSLVVPGFFGMATMCAVVHSFGATSPESTRFITLATSVATQWIRSASVGTSSGPSALPPGDCRANFTTSAVLTGATLKLSSAGNGVSGGSLRFSGSGGGGALTMAAKNSRSSFLRSSGVSPARLSAMRRFRPSVDDGPGHAPSGIGPCGRDGLDGVIDSGLLPLQVDSRQSLLRLASLPPTQTEPLQIFPRFVDRGVVLPDRLPALGRSHQRDCLLRSGSNCSAHLRVLGSSTLVAQRSDKGTGKATSRLGVPERAVVAPRWPLWRTVERVPKPKVADEQPMVGPQSQRRNGAAVGDAAALTKAHKHVVELCQPPRSVPAARVPPPPLAAHEGREPARKSSSAPVLPFSRAVTNSDRSDLRRTAFRSPRMTTLLEEGLSLIGAGSRRRVRAEQAGVPAAKPDVDPKQPRRQGDAATALLQPRSASRPEACPLVRLGLDAGEPHGPRRHPEDPIGPAQQQLGGRRHVADLASFARDGVRLADARSAALAWSCRIWPPQQLSAALRSHHEEVAAFICTVTSAGMIANANQQCQKRPVPQPQSPAGSDGVVHQAATRISSCVPPKKRPRLPESPECSESFAVASPPLDLTAKPLPTPSLTPD